MAETPQTEITDETLMALADGELPDDEARQVGMAVERDADLQARLRIFTETRDLLRAGAATGSVPGAPGAARDPLIARIRAATAAATVAAPAGAGMAPAPPPPAANLDRRPLVALAASLALAVVGLGWWWQSGGPQAALPPTHLAALDSLASGETQALPDGPSLTMIASYLGGAGDLCREYETRSGNTVTIRIACRADGGWDARFAEEITASNGYLPATGEIAALDAFLADAGIGPPLTPEEERAALSE